MKGNFLKEKIKNSGFQQASVAAKLGITPQSLESKLKSKDIKVSFLLEVAKAINKNVYYFFDELNHDYFVSEYNPSNRKEEVAEPIAEVTQLKDNEFLNKVSETIEAKLTPILNDTDNHINLLAEAQARTLVNQSEILDKLDLILSEYKKSSKNNKG